MTGWFPDFLVKLVSLWKLRKRLTIYFPIFFLWGILKGGGWVNEGNFFKGELLLDLACIITFTVFMKSLCLQNKCLVHFFVCSNTSLCYHES